MVVIVLLILSASAIAMPPSEPRSSDPNLQNEGVTKSESLECRYHTRGNKNANFKVGVTYAKQRQGRGWSASLDGGDRLVDLERLGDCDATLGAEFVVPQAANEGVTKME
jgi:hypothetical protein